MRRLASGLLLFLLLAPVSTGAQQPSGAAHAHPPPSELAAPIASALAPGGTEHRNEELDLRSFTMEVPVSRVGAPAGAIRSGLVLVGKTEA